MTPFVRCLMCLLFVVCLADTQASYADVETPPAIATSIWAVPAEKETAITVDSVWNTSIVTVARTCTASTCKAPEFSANRHISAFSRVGGARYLLSECDPAKRALRLLTRLQRVLRLGGLRLMPYALSLMP